MAEDLEWEALRPFVESLRKTRFAGEVRLFAAGNGESTLRRLGDEGVAVAPFRRLRAKRGRTVYQPLRSSRVTRVVLPLLRSASAPARERSLAVARLAAPISHPYVARYLRYYAFLSTAPKARYGNVMLTDVRDVFFQRDPFDFEIGTGVNCFLEDGRETLESEPANRTWLVMAYGEPVLTELGRHTISCAGVTIGSYEAVLAYLRVMVNALLRVPHQYPGIDQGVHNYVIRKGLVPNVNLVENGEGPVLTLGLVSPAEVAAALPDGYADVPILHQYDRHPQLREILLANLDPTGAGGPTGQTAALRSRRG